MEKKPSILRDLREERGLTQMEISGILGIKQQQYSKYENGHNELPLRYLTTMADYYNVPVDYLLGRTQRNHGTSYQNVYVTRDCSCEALMELVLSLSDMGRRDVIEFARFQRLKERKQEQAK